MLPHKHVIVSVVVGAIGWWVTGEPAAAPAALISGVLPDVDHVIDYAYYYRRGEHRLILLLHGYEYGLLGFGLAVLTGNKILGIAVLSYLVHLLADQLENRTHKLGYAFLFRAWHRFRIEAISTIPEDATRGRMADINLLKRLLHRR
jgi:hypothetical protein